MKTLTLKDLNATQMLDVVHELKTIGLVVGVDFDFQYTPGSWDWEAIKQIPRKTEFTFYNEEAATYFSLKYL
jgi:hypothetical protein